MVPEMMEILDDELYAFDFDTPLDSRPVWCPVIREMSAEECQRCLSSLFAKALTTRLSPPDHQDLVQALSHCCKDDIVGVYLTLEQVVQKSVDY